MTNFAKKILFISIAFLGLIITFALGMYSAKQLGCFEPIVTIEIINNTGFEIMELNISVGPDEGKIRKNAVIKNIPPKEYLHIPFLISGDCSFQVDGVLQNGKKIKQVRGYLTISNFPVILTLKDSN